ncbi:hypothetical protein D3C73_735850 [compost metagenome]
MAGVMGSEPITVYFGGRLAGQGHGLLYGAKGWNRTIFVQGESPTYHDELPRLVARYGF